MDPTALNIIAIDDEPDILAFLKKALEHRGHVVETRTSAVGLLEYLTGEGTEGPQAQPDLLILDNMMPGITGGRMLDLLADDARTNTIPVLLYSAMPMEELDVLIRQHPICEGLTKAGRLKEVFEAIERLVTLPQLEIS